MLKLRILHHDDCLVAVDKPSGFHVHPPEDSLQRISRKSNALAIVSRQIGSFLYPVHRLDHATSGVLLFALTREAASHLGQSFRERRIRKTYYAVARGWIPDSLTIERPLKPESGDGPELESRTEISPLARIELPLPSGPHATSRYTLVRAVPATGRFHQIRRHLAGASHPLIGDAVHGHGIHNRIFRDQLGIRGLLLKAQDIELPHPKTGERLLISSHWEKRWHPVFDLFGLCPFGQEHESEG